MPIALSPRSSLLEMFGGQEFKEKNPRLGAILEGVLGGSDPAELSMDLVSPLAGAAVRTSSKALKSLLATPKTRKAFIDDLKPENLVGPPPSGFDEAVKESKRLSKKFSGKTKVFHGTLYDFKDFAIGTRGGTGVGGIWTTDNIGTAGGYARGASGGDWGLANFPEKLTESQRRAAIAAERPKVINLEVNLKNPFVVPEGRFVEEGFEEPNTVKRLIELGYDGIVSRQKRNNRNALGLRDGTTTDVVNRMAFFPDQLKRLKE